MQTYKELKQQLIQIKSNDYNISGIDADGLIADMLKFIGHTDSELRDELIYRTFSELVDGKTLSTAQIKHILNTCLGEQHLFFGIGEKDTDSVFTRAFSSLPISVALWFNQNETPFLTADEIINIKNTVMRYISQEKDCRGYVGEKGWAHAIAHIADVLGHLAEVSETTDGDDEFSLGCEGLLEILNAVKLMVCNEDSVYTAEEDERLAVPVMDVIYREILTNDEIIGWIDSFNMADTKWKNGSFPSSFHRYVNCKNFMRSLYFKLCADDDYEEICKHMLSFLAEA
ncbi:MAG: DUF2785 domain-containing protein [Defluviitaleaceae bacterium]|nr:DUF2785 domain-containing protein [Defluviitaleaceae bacterium]